MSDPAQSDRPTAGTQKATCLAAAVFVALLAGTATTAFVLLGDGSKSAGPGPLEHPAVGQKLPRLELRPLTDAGIPPAGNAQVPASGRVSLDDLAGRVVLLYVWGPWCPACLAELPEIARIEAKFRSRPDFRFLAVSCGQDLPEDLEELRLDTNLVLFPEHVDMPTYADPGGVSRLAIGEVVTLDALPVTLILDRGGVIRGVWQGPADRNDLEDLISRLLEEA